MIVSYPYLRIWLLLHVYDMGLIFFKERCNILTVVYTGGVVLPMYVMSTLKFHVRIMNNMYVMTIRQGNVTRHDVPFLIV